MITKCDKFWWQLNKKNIIFMFCTLPLAIIFPILSLLIPTIFLYGFCDKYLVFSNCGETHEDSMRFIMTMPFSRKAIFNTYLKGLLLTSLAYTFAISLIRLLLTLTKLSKVFFWSSNINNFYDFFIYTAILIIYLIITLLFLLILMRNYTVTKKSQYISLGIFLVLPLISLLMFLKNILVIITGLSQTKMNVTYDVVDIYKMGISEEIASSLAIIILLIVLGFLLYLLYALIANLSKKSRGGLKNV